MSQSTDIDLRIRRLVAGSDGFFAQLDALTEWAAVADPALEQAVAGIVERVRKEGDSALVEFSRQFDQRTASNIGELVVDREQMNAALQALPGELREALELAAQRIRSFHEHQKQESWEYTDAQGVRMGQQLSALQRVGIYVPGGQAAYPSSVLMNAIPAAVAGVEQIVMVSPAPADELNPVVLAAAALAGVDECYTVGGAQAIAALAYGTQTIARVDKIVGPGNRYVACAKRQVFGQVGLDMVAGPSEILVVCDGQTNPDWIAMDMFSQAEHDADAQAILVCPDDAYFDAVQASMERLLPDLERRDTIVESLNNRGAFVLVADLDAAMTVVNRISPEHLELSVADPDALLSQVRNAGAVFLGRSTPEAFGDYCAGPNHVLPTSTTARFASPLGVYDFQKRSSIIQCSDAGAAALADVAEVLANSESLTAHAASARMRRQP